MNTQNILNYNLRKTDIMLDSSEYYDVTLCNDQFNIDNRLLGTVPIVYESNVLNYDFVIPNTLPETLTLSNNEGTILTLPYEVFVSHFDINYKNTFLPTDKYNFEFNTLSFVFKIISFNNTIDLGEFGVFTLPEIMGFFKSIIRSIDLDVVTTKSFVPYPQKIKIGDKKLFNIRENSGWTWELLFNPNILTWGDDKTFLYLGMKGDDKIENLSDNSLSFSFNSDHTIKWSKTQLIKICGEENEYETFTGKTKELKPVIGKNFLITIVFDRYYDLYDCDLLNKGGENDYITDLDNPETHKLSQRWLNQEYYRKGRLSVYCNGKLLSRFENWSELVLSNRGTQPYIVSFGGLTDENNPYNSVSTEVDIKKVKYYNEPLHFTYIKHNFQYSY